MAPADNIRQRDQRVIAESLRKEKGRHRKMKKNVKRLIAGAVVLLVAAGYCCPYCRWQQKRRRI